MDPHLKCSVALAEQLGWRPVAGSGGLLVPTGEQVAQPQDEAMLARLRRTTARGRPLGSDSFLSKLERALGRCLRPLPGGRPRKAGQTPKRRKN